MKVFRFNNRIGIRHYGKFHYFIRTSSGMMRLRDNLFDGKIEKINVSGCILNLSGVSRSKLKWLVIIW